VFFPLQRAGDVVFIPSQWWHTAINLETEPQATGFNSPPFRGAIAVTANNINRGNFLDALKFLKKIGRDDLRADLQAGVERVYPGLYDELSRARSAQVEARVSQVDERVRGQVADGVVQSSVSVVRKDLASFFSQPAQKPSFAIQCDSDEEDESKVCETKVEKPVVAEAAAAAPGFSFGFSFE
jgi:hypothetical protein